VVSMMSELSQTVCNYARQRLPAAFLLLLNSHLGSYCLQQVIMIQDI